MPMQRLLALFGSSSEAAASRNPFAKKLAEHLTELAPERLEYVAGFAGQLTRVAYADNDVSEVERTAITRVLRERSILQSREADAVIDLLVAQLEALRGTEEFQLNRAINNHASAEEKEALVDCLYAVGAADDTVSNIEDQEIRTISHALNIPNERLMDIRSRYRDHLEVLKHAAALRKAKQP